VLEDGAYADVAFRAEADRERLAGRERAFAMRLAYGTVQRKATLDWLAEKLTRRPAAELDAPLLAALSLGLYQLVWMAGVADHAAVNESVELAKGQTRGGHRLVNAALRRGARQARSLVEGLGEETPTEAALRHSHPQWIAELWWDMLGPEEARALMRRDNEPAESSVRANVLRSEAAELVEALAREGVSARADPLLPEAVVLEQPYDVHGSPLYERGLYMPQSRGSMLVARAMDPQPGERVLDLCAAPGSKTTHLAALMGDEGEVVAVDLDPRRTQAIELNRDRLGIRCVEVRTGDAARDDFGGGFDRVLVDPPCTDLGTLQSRPDARWRKHAAQAEALQALQAEILDNAASALRAGGRLVYSTCTIDPVENEDQIAAFLERHPGFAQIDLVGSYPAFSREEGSAFLQTLPHRHGTDGFFVAAVQRGRK
jgi:16S rRNA (cytosine967-C5)-methyltransferase